MIRPDWDVVVIGGGPAGSSAAITLAQAGWSVIVIEAQAYPHDKVCGEFLSPDGAATLDGLVAQDRTIDQRAVVIRRVTIDSSNGGLWSEQLPGRALGISRAFLDDQLQQRAQRVGAVVQTGARVDAVRGSLLHGFEVHLRAASWQTTLRARAVIGAFGKRSQLDSMLQRRFIHRRQDYLALKAHFWGPALGDRIELHAFPGGYCGLSDIEGERRNVCLLVRQSVFQRVSRNGGSAGDSFVDWMLSHNPSLADWFGRSERIHDRWMAIAQIPFEGKELVVNDLLMVGDAAGVVAPLAGDGISIALDSGRMAAHLLTSFLQGQLSGSSLLSEYQRQWQRSFGRRMWLGRTLQPVLLDPSGAGVMLRLASKLPGLGKALIAQTRGKTGNRNDQAVGLKYEELG